MFDKFTERARKVMSLAHQEAQRLNTEFIGTEHILLGIIQEGGVAAKVLKNLNVDLKRIRTEIEKLVRPSPNPTVTLGQLPFSPRANRVIELAGEEAGRLGYDVIGTEHLLLGLLKEDEGIAAQVLTNLKLKLDEVRDMVLEVFGASVPKTFKSKKTDGKPATVQQEVLKGIVEERARQDRRWGQQRHTGGEWLAILMEEVGEVAKDMLEGPNGHMRGEIEQVAAVAVAWLESLDQKDSKPEA